MTKTLNNLQMKISPILFSTPMVSAILEGRKTMTRRLNNLQEVNKFPNDVQFIGFQDFPDGSLKAIFQADDSDEAGSVKFTYGKIGDIIWVRESWSPKYVKGGLDGFKLQYPEKYPWIYKADYPDQKQGYAAHAWKPSIHMPKEAARLFLKITHIRVERLQDISEEDAMAEGINKQFYHDRGYSVPESMEEFWANGYYKRGFKILWESINGAGSWQANPWVWVISFERAEKPNQTP